MYQVIRQATAMLYRDSYNGSENDKIPQDNLLELCRVVFLCAGRTPTYDLRGLLRDDFSQLIDRLRAKLKSLPDPTGSQYSRDVFQWQCVLDMAMRLNKGMPGIINNSMLEALHVRSVKMFDVMVGWIWILGEHIKRPEDTSQTQDAQTGPGEVDWKTVLDGYVEVEVRDNRQYTEYGNRWDYQRLRVDCKHRIEFMLNFRHLMWREDLDTIFRKSQF